MCLDENFPNNPSLFPAASRAGKRGLKHEQSAGEGGRCAMIPMAPYGLYPRYSEDGYPELMAANHYTVFKELIQEIREDEDCRAFFKSVQSTMAWPFVACASGAHRVVYYFAGQFLGMAPPGVATSTRALATAALAEIAVVGDKTVTEAKGEVAEGDAAATEAVDSVADAAEPSPVVVNAAEPPADDSCNNAEHAAAPSAEPPCAEQPAEAGQRI